MKNFAIIGVAGYVAPRHLQAIRDTGNTLVAAIDKSDSVGILDSYFPHADFFTEFERFDRHLEKLRRDGKRTDYVTICSPNYLHDAHIRFALRQHADAICEKPLVLNPWNLDALSSIEKESGRKVFTILQLRLHPAIVNLKRQVESAPKDKHFKIDLRYITSRGNWYHHSWKGDISKSGGVITNIGIHLFDMLLWVFGGVKQMELEKSEQDHASGKFELERATVEWFLSINPEHLPLAIKASGKRTYRSFQIENSEVEFSDGFADLHTVCYKNILEGKGFGIEDARPSIETAYKLRSIKK